MFEKKHSFIFLILFFFLLQNQGWGLSGCYISKVRIENSSLGLLRTVNLRTCRCPFLLFYVAKKKHLPLVLLLVKGRFLLYVEYFN